VTLTTPETNGAHSKPEPGTLEDSRAGVTSLLHRVKVRVLTALGRPPRRKVSVAEIIDRLDHIDRVCKKEYGHLCQIRLEKRVPVNQPLVMISQIQRSGGTLLSQLFDMHPQCHAHPYELFIGYPKKMHWPALDLGATPKTWFTMLFEKPVLRAFEDGYTKYSKGAVDEELEVFPFIFLPSLQKQIFDACVKEREIQTTRDIFDCYFTSYFNAWLDNHNLYVGGKRMITAFVPRMGMDQANIDRFFFTYQDGKLISIIRDPRSWWASARKHKPAVYGELDKALALWNDSTEATLAAMRAHGQRVCTLIFDDLVVNTEQTMRRLAEYLGIDFHPTLLTPTFNGFPIKADSSYQVKSHGVIKDPVSRYKQVLTPAELEAIEKISGQLYAEAVRMVRQNPYL
jgi:hypothetical protein